MKNYDDAANFVLTCKEVERKLDKHHICSLPQDDNTIQVWLLLCSTLCLQCLADALMQCANFFTMVRCEAMRWYGTDQSACLTSEGARAVHAEGKG